MLLLSVAAARYPFQAELRNNHIGGDLRSFKVLKTHEDIHSIGSVAVVSSRTVSIVGMKGKSRKGCVEEGKGMKENRKKKFGGKEGLLIGLGSPHSRAKVLGC